jgi:hypothetical protein
MYGSDPTAQPQAAYDLPPLFRAADEIRTLFGRAQEKGDHTERGRRFLTSRCADYASFRGG